MCGVLLVWPAYYEHVFSRNRPPLCGSSIEMMDSPNSNLHTHHQARSQAARERAELEARLREGAQEAVQAALLEQAAVSIGQLEAAMASATDERERACAALEQETAALRSDLAVARAEAQAAREEAASAHASASHAAGELDTLRQSRAVLSQELNELRSRLERALATADDFHARFLQVGMMIWEWGLILLG